MRNFSLLLFASLMTVSSWGIGTEGKSLHERPDWWKQYDGAPPIEVRPEVIPPQGDTPSVVQEAVTRNPNQGVPETLVVQPEGTSGTVGIPKAIDSEQVLQSANETLHQQGRGGFLRGIALFVGFLLFGGGAVFGLIRWWSAQVPEPPKPSRRTRF